MELDNLEELESNLFSNDWEVSVDAADKLAGLNTPESIAVLIKAIDSDDNFIRNAAALGIREANNEVAFLALWNRIIELGPDEEIGTLVYSMEMADCSNYLLELINLYFNGNYEVENSTSVIINEQTFNLTKEELIKIKEELNNQDMTLEDLNVKYKLNDVG